MSENEIAKIVVDSAFKIHTKLGPGLLESVYEVVLKHELEQRGLNVIRQQALPVIYDEVKLEKGYRIDLLVENKVLIELKSVESIALFIKNSCLPILNCPISDWGY